MTSNRKLKLLKKKWSYTLPCIRQVFVIVMAAGISAKRDAWFCYFCSSSASTCLSYLRF